MLRVIALWFTCSMGIAAQGQTMIVGSYNIRYETSADTGNLWVDRLPILTSLLKFHAFDVFGTQEGLHNQLDDIRRTLPEYDYYGAGRDDGKEKGEHSAIFFRKDRFSLIDKGDFWLSKTPEKPSKGWDATCCNRLCSWVKLKDRRAGRDLFVFNAHYDHEGETARLESSKLILQKIKAIAKNAPVIFCGDLNCARQSEPINFIIQSGLLNDSYQQAAIRYANNGTFNGFGNTLDSKDIIDHIFVTTHFEAARFGVLSDSYQGKFPSDHFPVLAELKWKFK